MREFESVFDKGLLKGLRSEAIEPAGDQRLTELKNLRPHEFGLRPVETITYPFDDVVFAYPFPQLFLLRELRLMATETAVYTCDSSWSPTLAIGSLAAGGIWHVADFGDYILMTNGSQLVQRYGSTGAWSKFAKTSSIPPMKTVCNFRGQIVGGNVTAGQWEDCASNYVVWSDIGSANFYPDQKNEAGYAPMSWNGDVLRVLPLGDMVAVYGVNGVSLLKPTNQYMGIKELNLPGIPTAGAAGGGHRGHVFVDYGGDVWMMAPDGQPKNLGYSEYISTMDASELVVSYNRHQDEYYISDNSKCFILGKNGLCQTHQIVSSCDFDNGVLYGTWESDRDRNARITTDVLDFGQRAFKTLATLSANCSSTNSMWLSIYWRSNVVGSFDQSQWQMINPTGFATPMVTAVDFKLAFEADDYTNTKLVSLRSRLKLSDKRVIRGAYSAT